jgi:outer membrane receptor protein involved in Fe transport
MTTRLFKALAGLVCATSMFAQTAGMAGLTGVVTDASGAVVPNAKVVVANESKGINRSLETNQEGIFTAPSLVPSAGYSVSVNTTGFTPYERKDITLQVGQQLNLNIVLNVAQAAQTVEVTSGAPLVETTKTGVSQVVGTQQIDNLPINGRRVDTFVLLTPGVTNDGQFGLVSFRGVAGGNTYLTDGNDTTQQFYNENAGRTRISSQISQDAVQEFQVLSNGYSAEFGRAIGGVINTVTRSGTNDVHGTAYWFFRNRSLNARDRYATFNPPEYRHQAGASLGGPIKKDKVFYFANAEFTRRNFPGVNRVINNAFTNTIGDFNAPCTAPLTPEQCTAARNYVMRGNNVLIPRRADSDMLFGKIDWQANERHSFSFSANYMDWISPNGIQTQAVLTSNNLLSNNANSTVRTRYGRAVWTAIPTVTMVNELRFGYFKDRLFDDFNPDFIPRETGRVGVSLAGTMIGVAIDYPRLNPSEQRFQIADNLSWTIGTHALKIGADISTTQDYLNILRNQFGNYAYQSFQNFALDFSGPTAGGRRYQTFTQTFGNPILDFKTNDYAFYVQDQWRATQKLTLNLGLRYEYSDLPTPSQVNPDYPQTGRINQPTRNFAPRGSVSYAFNERTVVRAGFGMFYSRYQGALLQTLFFSNGLYQPSIQVVPTQAGAPNFPNNLTTLAGFPTGNVSLSFAAPNFRNPYSLQGDIAFERELTPNLGVTASYVYSRGLHLFTVRDLNIGPEGPPVTYRVNDASGNQVSTFTTPTYLTANRVDPRYQRINQIENGGQSWYHGMILQLNKRFSHGITGSVAYTLSKAEDLGNIGGGNDALFFNFPRTFNNSDYSIDRGRSNLDQRHRLVMNSVWAPTFTKSDSFAARYLINGWQLSQITTIASAQGANPTIRVIGTPFAGAAFPQTINGFNGGNRVPFLKPYSIPIDNIFRVDARLSRELPFTERVRLWLNFEAFNVFNHVSNTGVLTEAYSLSNGVLSPTPNTGAGTASQGFPDGTNARRAQVSLRLVF